MLSDKELDDTQVYMKEQEGENAESISEDREGIHHDRNAAGDSGIYSDMTDCIQIVMKRRQSQT